MKCSRSSCWCTTGTTSRSDARIQGWLVLGPGDITLPRMEASIVLVWRNRPWRLEPSVRFVFIYLCCLSLSSCCWHHPLVFINNNSELPPRFQNERQNACCVCFYPAFFFFFFLRGGSRTLIAFLFFSLSAPLLEKFKKHIIPADDE